MWSIIVVGRLGRLKSQQCGKRVHCTVKRWRQEVVHKPDTMRGSRILRAQRNSERITTTDLRSVGGEAMSSLRSTHPPSIVGFRAQTGKPTAG